MEEAATAAAVMEAAAVTEGGDTPDSQVLIPEADFMEAARVAGMADTRAEATIMEATIMEAMAGTITEGLRREGPYSELFWVE
jgi:hypothetical protein